jgi:hypothetical protein
MNAPALPDVARTAAQLAANHAKATVSIDSLFWRIDSLVDAAARRDWHEVRSQSQTLAEASRAAGYRGISAMAQRVSEEAAQTDNDSDVKRSVIRLLGTSGRTRLPDPDKPA